MHSITRRQTLADLLRRSAARTPDKLAVVCGETSWTYAEFNRISERVAAGLAERGVTRGARVAVLARNFHAFVAMRFALARLGAVLVPINFMLKAEEVAYILRHAGATMLATDSGLAALARAAKGLDTAVRDLIWLPAEGPSEAQADMIGFETLAACETSPPDPELTGDDLTLHALPLYHCAQLDVFFGPSIYIGATNV